MKAIHKVDLNKIEGTGDFPCPVCGSVISPDDVEEKTYKIIEVRSIDGLVDEIILKCKKCQSTISVVGFDEVSKEEEKTAEVKPLRGRTDKQIIQLLQDGSRLTLYEISEKLRKKPKVVFKAIRKLFENGKINNDPATRTYGISD